MVSCILAAYFASTSFSAWPKPSFDEALAWKHLEAQVAFGPRVPGTDGHAKTAEHILAHMRQYCENVRTQPFSHRWSQTGKDVHMMNLIGEQNWKDAEVRVLLLAHWDTRPTADHDPDPRKRNQPILGANDGASGVAVLMELMRVMKDRNPKLGIMYLFTDGEDLGPSLDEMFLGAREFAKNLPRPRPDYGILLDMIGDADLRIPMEANSFDRAGEVLKAFYKHAHAQGMQDTFPWILGDPISDDHLPLNDAGVPTIDLIDFTYEPWHTTHDTVDKCSAESLGKVGKTLETWLAKPQPWRPPA